MPFRPLCHVRSALKKTSVQDFNCFSIMFYYISSTTYQKIGDLYCPVHIQFNFAWCAPPKSLTFRRPSSSSTAVEAVP